MELRYYQRDAVNAVESFIQRSTANPCVEIPTGGGKTPIIATLCRDLVEAGYRVLTLAHRKELLTQTEDALRQWAPDVDFGLVSAGLNRKEYDKPVVVAGIQSVFRNAIALERRDFVIVDEAHLIPPESERKGGMYRTLLDGLNEIHSGTTVIGLTATPYRLASGEVCGPENVLNEIVYRVSIPELIQGGFLSPLTSKAPDVEVEFDDVKIVAGEFQASGVEERFNDAVIERCAEQIVKHTIRRDKVVVFCPSVDISKRFAKIIARKTGDAAAVATVFGDTTATERAAILERFKQADSTVKDLFGTKQAPLKYLVNVDVLTTGFDARNIDCVALVRPTASPGLYYQMIGRGFRIAPGKKDCLVLDFGGNMKRFGPVDAIQPPQKGERRSKEPKMKTCPRCDDVLALNALKCGNCGFEFEPPQDDFLCPACGEGNNKRNKFCHNCGFQFPVAVKFEGEADFESSILSTERVFTDGKRIPDFREKIRKTRYLIGQNTKKGTPPYLLVKYETESGADLSEFVCFAHTGFARTKACEWWKARSKIRPVPVSARQALNIINWGGCVAEPTFATYAPKTDAKSYPKTKSVETEPPPELPERYPKTDDFWGGFARCERCSDQKSSYEFYAAPDKSSFQVVCARCGDVVYRSNDRNDFDGMEDVYKIGFTEKELGFDDYGDDLPF